MLNRFNASRLSLGRASRFDPRGALILKDTPPVTVSGLMSADGFTLVSADGFTLTPTEAQDA